MHLSTNETSLDGAKARGNQLGNAALSYRLGRAYFNLSTNETSLDGAELL